jgi:hypothetical protein
MPGFARQSKGNATVAIDFAEAVVRFARKAPPGTRDSRLVKAALGG